MEVPEGYTPKDKSANGLRLVKSLYGLKQASRCWWTLIRTYLEELGFTRLHSDWGLYTRISETETTYVLVYVDDVLIASREMDTVTGVKEALKRKWRWTDSGEAGYILGFKITRDLSAKSISLSQTAYIEQVLERFQLTDANVVSTPLIHGIHLVTNNASDTNFERQTLYRAMVGTIMWLSLSTRPDMAYAASTLGQFNQNPGNMHIESAKRVLRYLKKTANAALVLGSQETALLRGWCDADYGGDLDRRKSTTGFVFKLFGSSVTWNSIRQPTVALSTCEAEYMALTEAAKEASYLRQLLDELRLIDLTKATTLLCDNQGAMALANNPSHHRRSKHIAIRFHYIREAVESKTITLTYIATRLQIADIFTKALPHAAHVQHFGGLGLRVGGLDVDKDRVEYLN
jgi:hypothetical protein